jgi:PncC family amidohydrolase
VITIQQIQESIQQKAEDLVKRLTETHKTITLSESCTGGKVADALVCVPGASLCFWGGFVTYTIAAKIAMLNIDAALISKFGAVSRECAEAMANGALSKSGSDYAGAATGLAGPSGDASAAVVGTVWVSLAEKGSPPITKCFHFEGSRAEIRAAAVEALLELVLSNIHAV